MTPPTTVRHLPGPSDTDAWTDKLVAEIAAGIERSQTEPISRDELVATYGTDDPDVLRATFALAEDVAAAERYAAERYAAEGRQVAA